MKFEMWSFWHILYMISPFIIFAGIYFFIRNKSKKEKENLGIILGVISILTLVVRNVDIFIRDGWDLEVIPLQVCHIGSLIAGLALITKKKWLISTAFCFNIIPAFLAMLFADALANYDTILKIRAQSYIWGHIFIIVCALYGVMVYLPKLTKKDLVKSLVFVGSMAIVAIICNSAFRAILGWESNYFYLYNYEGTPLKFLYNIVPSSTYGWFTINLFYVISLLAFFVLVFIGMFVVSNIIVNKLSKGVSRFEVKDNVVIKAKSNDNKQIDLEVTSDN